MASRDCPLSVVSYAKDWLILAANDRRPAVRGSIRRPSIGNVEAGEASAQPGRRQLTVDKLPDLGDHDRSLADRGGDALD
jgi:hypothetical protein